MPASARLVVALMLAVIASPGPAGEPDPLQLTAGSFHDVDSMMHAAKGRPNEEKRLVALKAYVRGDHARAAAEFAEAAYYADKYSQHALSLMHWHGIGVPVDRVQAYVWADLAAERGTDRLLVVRERMWNDLDEAQRARVGEVGPAWYARYGDEIAKPRAESEMRRFAKGLTGSHLGFDRSTLAIGGRPTGGTYGPQVGNAATFYINSSAASPAELYEGSRRDIAAYWSEQDRQLTGTGRAGDLEDVHTRRAPD